MILITVSGLAMQVGEQLEHDKTHGIHQTLSRFFPRYQMTDRPPTPVEQVYRLAEAAQEYLSHVYTGNC